MREEVGEEQDYEDGINYQNLNCGTPLIGPTARSSQMMLMKVRRLWRASGRGEPWS